MNYKTALVWTIVLVGIIFTFHGFYDFSLLWGALPLLFLLYFIIKGSADIQSGFFVESICSGRADTNSISITFDDGPDEIYTPKVLEVLKEYSAPACFFIIGSKIKGRENILNEIVKNGHELGNHTYTHSYWIDFKNQKGFEKEIKMTESEIEAVCGLKTQYFRPPYGVTTPGLAAACKSLKYSVIAWNIRSLDAGKDTEEQILNRINPVLAPGSIILFHDKSEKTVNVLRKVLEHARKNGLNVVPLQKLTGIETYA